MFDPVVITEATVGQLAWHLQHIHMRLFWASVPEAEPAYALQVHRAIQSSPLREEIGLLCRAANGEIDRASASEAVVAEVVDTVQSIVEATAAAPLGAHAYTIADSYWSTPIGEVVASALAWARGDDLISYMDAGRLLVEAGLTPYRLDQLEDRTVQKALAARVRRLAESGRVRQYRNPAPGGPARGDWLLSRQEVEAYVAALDLRGGEAAS